VRSSILHWSAPFNIVAVNPLFARIEATLTIIGGLIGAGITIFNGLKFLQQRNEPEEVAAA